MKTWQEEWEIVDKVPFQFSSECSPYPSHIRDISQLCSPVSAGEDEDDGSKEAKQKWDNQQAKVKALHL